MFGKIKKLNKFLIISVLMFVFVYSFFHFAQTGMITFNHHQENSGQNNHSVCFDFFNIQNKTLCSQKDILDLLSTFVLSAFFVFTYTFVSNKKDQIKITRIKIPSYLQILFSRGILHGKIYS